MKVLIHKIVPVLFALGGVLWLVPTVKRLIQGEPLDLVPLGAALALFTLAVVFFAVGRSASGPPSA
jgi:hypothetical protein